MTSPHGSLRVFVIASLLAGASACSVTVAPVVTRDPEIACPGGITAWQLKLTDQRADRRDAEMMFRAVRDSVTRSLPGCHWVESGAPTIAIEIHRFDVRSIEGTWEANVEWSVLVSDGGGRTVTEFQSESSIARPNYRGQDNEKAALQEALTEAMRRTLTGLRGVSNVG
jgi:hypothetical protein